MYESINNVIFEFSYITKLGDIDKKKTFILGKALHEMLVACNLKKGPFFVYDKTPLKRSLSGLQTVNLENNSLPHYFYQPRSIGLSQNRVRFNSDLAVTHFLKIQENFLYL